MLTNVPVTGEPPPEAGALPVVSTGALVLTNGDPVVPVSAVDPLPAPVDGAGLPDVDVPVVLPSADGVVPLSGAPTVAWACGDAGETP